MKHVIEGAIQKKGEQWEVAIIGGEPVTVGDEDFIASRNGRFYSVAALKESVPLWDGVKVYDNHLTDEEFRERAGMRSPVKEWLGTIVETRWDEASNSIKGIFKVVDESLSAKLIKAESLGVLGSIGLSIDTFPVINRQVEYNGQNYDVIDGFQTVLSVDLVSEPAAGGHLERAIASVEIKERNKMKDEKEVKEDEAKQESQGFDVEALRGIIAEMVAEITAAKQEAGAEPTQEADTEPEQESPEVEEAKAILESLKVEKCQLQLDRRLESEKLPDAAKNEIRKRFSGKVFDAEDLDGFITAIKESIKAVDKTGEVNVPKGSKVESVFDENDKFALALAEAIMGHSTFSRVAESDDESVRQNVRSFEAYNDWVKKGKPQVGSPARLSELLWERFGGNPLFDARAYEAATTSSMSSVVKNTLNLMVAANYSTRHRWFDPLVVTEEVSTIDEATLARLYGYSDLAVVNEGAAYAEISQSDEEETAQFVKRGGYIGITLEMLMSDKVNYIRSIPVRLSNAWFNTLSGLVANVFTVNSGAGPVLSDTGALFNATAATTAGGHANLGTTALSYSTFSAARTAMRKQTDQALGAGRRLQINPKFLLVPDDLETTGLQIRNSEYQPNADGAGTTGNQSVNPFYQQFEVVPVPDWTDTNDWALVGDPSQFPAIYLIFPRGQRTPQLFTSDNETTGTMFTNDEIRYKVRMMTWRFSSSYDCAPVADFRPLYKANVL